MLLPPRRAHSRFYSSRLRVVWDLPLLNGELGFFLPFFLLDKFSCGAVRDVDRVIIISLQINWLNTLSIDWCRLGWYGGTVDFTLIRETCLACRPAMRWFVLCKKSPRMGYTANLEQQLVPEQECPLDWHGPCSPDSPSQSLFEDKTGKLFAGHHGELLSCTDGAYTNNGKHLVQQGYEWTGSRFRDSTVLKVHSFWYNFLPG